MDSTDVLNKLRMRHASGDRWAGIDVDGADPVRDNLDAFVWEPSLVKTNAISSAVEAACLILSVDETVKNPQSEQVCSISYVVLEIANMLLNSRILALALRRVLLSVLYGDVEGVDRDGKKNSCLSGIHT